jgi:hypothetical protein
VATTSIADVIRSKLDAGTLPLKLPRQIWAGNGSDRACAVCDASIPKSQVEYELEYDGGVTIVFHADCHAMWDAQVRKT